MAATRDWMTVNQFYKKYKGKLGRNVIYEGIKDRSIPSIRVGRRILIPSDALDRMLEK